MKSSVALVLLILVATPAAAETISGHACYRFSRGETLRLARAKAAAMAERNALEDYRVFTEAISAVQDPALRADFVLSLTSGVLRDVETTSELMELDTREVCRSITAHVEPDELISSVVAKMNAPHGVELMGYSLFPQNNLARVLEAVSFKRGDRQRIVFLFECKRKGNPYLDTRHTVQQEHFRIRLSWIDHGGLPGAGALGSGDCGAPGAVSSIEFPLPPWDFKYWIDLPDTTREFKSWDVH